jgi:hypothetical protein
MIKKIKPFLIHLLILFPLACGTGIGNGIWGDPTTPPSNSAAIPAGEDRDNSFSIPIYEYSQSTFSDCGKFTEQSSVAEVDAGRACIHNAFDTCTESKYLLNKLNSDDSRFVSFVSVEKIPEDETTCQLRVHTVSNVPPNPIDVEKTCTTLQPGEYIETACGVGN